MSTILTANFRIADIGNGKGKIYVHMQGRGAFTEEEIDMPEGLHPADAISAAMQGTAERIDRIMAEKRRSAHMCGQCGSFFCHLNAPGRGVCLDFPDANGAQPRRAAWDAACDDFERRKPLSEAAT